MHTAASGSIEEGKGIALRFPRHIRNRDDKKPEEGTNTDQIIEMYKGQANLQQMNFNDDNDFDLWYMFFIIFWKKDKKGLIKLIKILYKILKTKNL